MISLYLLRWHSRDQGESQDSDNLLVALSHLTGSPCLTAPDSL